MAHLRGVRRLLKMTISHVSGWHRYAILSGESIKGRQSVAAPLASGFFKSDHLKLSISLFLPFNVAKCCQRTAVTMASNIGKNKTRRLNELAKHRNQICKTRHSEKPASLKLVQLAPRSFCHAVDGIWEQPVKSNFSRGELRKTSSRSAAPSAPLVSSSKHLECSREDGGGIQPPGRWHIQKGTFMPPRPQSSKKLAFVGGRPYYHLDGAKRKICHKPQKILAW